MGAILYQPIVNKANFSPVTLPKQIIMLEMAVRKKQHYYRASQRQLNIGTLCQAKRDFKAI
ncbi:MAG TPA: hypothetical protein DEF07_06865 [Nitrosomonas sp.]|nr:hypothetical protein [Nitrosomonas sp.]